MSTTTGGGEFGNPLRKFKLVFLGEQSGKQIRSGPILALIWMVGRKTLEEVFHSDVAS